MLHIRPVTEEDASDKVRKAYEDIKNTLHIHFVPLVFQYLAGFEEYFLYAWEKIKTNIQSPYYATTTQEIIQKSQTGITHIYKQSKAMHAFMASVGIPEKQAIQETVGQLQLLNAQLLLLTIGLREGVKGVTVGQQVLSRDATYEETIFDQFINQKIMHHNLKSQEADIVPAVKMLAPLFGNQSLVISRYPEFFAHTAHEMQELTKTEHYLSERVGMEQFTLMKALTLPYPLGCSYAEIAQFAGKKPYFAELLYILSETFPTSFPKLVFATALMQSVLSINKAIIRET